MAPSRKKGANKAKLNGQLSLGDLVLAKVKGFPAWPAKISRPEDWKRTHDPRKYFVQFFGTEEIAFVAPADIQAFTSEAKIKLSARGQPKTKHFARAVKEICEAFEELQQKHLSDAKCTTDKSVIGSEGPSTDGLKDDVKKRISEVGRNGEAIIDEPGDHGTGLERCSSRQAETVNQGLEPTGICLADHSSHLHETSKKKLKASNGLHLPRESEKFTSSPVSSQMKEDFSSNKIERDVSVEQPNGSSQSNCLSDLSGGSACEPMGSPLASGGSIHMKQAETGGGQGGFANGHKSKMSSGSKGKHRSSKNTHKSGSSGLHSFKYIESSDPGDVSEFFEKLKTGLQSKYSAGECMEDSPSRALRVDLSSSGRKQWSMLEGKIDNEVASGLQKDVVGSPKKLMGRKPYIKKKVAELEGRQPNLAVNVISRPSKRSKCADLYVEGTNRSVTRNTRIDSSSYNIDSNKIGKYVDIKLKEDSQMASRPQKAMILSNSSDDDSILPLMKRHCKSSESIPGSAIPSSEDRMDKDHAMQKNDRPQSDESGFSASKLHSKRRAVCIYEEEEDEEQPKTPIHAGCARMVKKPSSLANSVLSSNVPNERTEIAEKNIKVFCELKDDPTKEAMLLDKPARELSTSILRSPVRLESEKLFLKDTKPVSVSLINSPCLASGAKTEQHKAINPPDEVSNVSSLKKASSDKVSGLSSDSLPQHQVMVQKSRLISTGGALKATPKAKFLVKDVAVTAGENSAGNVSFPVGRLRIGGDDQSRSVIDTKTADSSISMRHLIAAAQEKRRLAHLQNISHVNPSLSMLTATDAQGVCSSPVPEVQPFSYATSNLTLPDLRRFNLRSAFASPSSHSYQSSSLHQVDELEERRVSSGHQAAGGSLSGGTEAAVARDAFEGMIETLSRTKESIGRATRLAIDCAKYGIANEVVELLIRKLESEPSFHRRVDLFFLVDSITQCSHSQKGIAGASYIPTVQAALPRLLGAAAPSGANARENRRQCLKVLRLWLERKILPELVLRRYMNDIGVPSDDVSSSCFLRRPSRVERAVDDPIREMEGMLVDEYGSNATFQLPGFFPSNAFEDEDDDQPSSTCKEADDGPYVDSQVCEQTESCMDTPNDRRHQILEDVDGELEMEDASEHRKDGRSMSTNHGASIETIKQSSDRNSGLFSDGYTEFPPLPEGSPPLPLESPPLPPPLPSSPPPSPPPLPPSSPSPPPPPPPLPLDPPPADAHPSGPMHSVHSQLLLPSQPSVLSQPILPSKPSLQSSPQQLTYQPHVPHDYCSTPGGNQLVQMAENASLGVHADGTIQKEIFSQMSPCFGKAGAQSSREIVSSRKLEYGKKDVYLNSQPSQTCQLFQSSNSPFVQRPSHTVSIQQPPGNFSYAQPPLQQQLSHPYPQTYSFPSLPDGRRQFSADEQWRMPSSEFTDSQHGGWMSGGRNPSCSGQPFVKEGYVRPSLDRLPTNVVFQPSTPNTARAPVPGRGVPQMLSCRADVSGINCWRPV